MSLGKNIVKAIPAEKMALLVEKGLDKARLSRAEKIALADCGLSEFYTIKKNIKTPVSKIDPQLIENVMAVCFPSKGKSALKTPIKEISIQLTSSAIKILKNTLEWQINSPLFAKRGDESGSISFYKTSGKFTVHFEITKDCEQRSCITVMLTDNLKKELSFDAALFENRQCIESVHVSKNPVALFSGVTPGDYLLKVSKNKGEIISINIRLEK